MGFATCEKSRVVAGKNAYRLTEDLTQTKIAVLDSIYVWQPGKHPAVPGTWIEPFQTYTEHYTVYIADLIHKDTRAVIKVVRYGLTIACFPDARTVELGERQIARQGNQSS